MFATWKFDWEKIKNGVNKIQCVYSDNDPYVPVSYAEQLHELTGAELKLMPGQKHFSISTFSKYSKFPELLDLV